MKSSDCSPRSAGVRYSRTGWVASLVLLLLPATPLLAQPTASLEFFEKKIRPVLADQCQACHNPQLLTSGLDLTTEEAFRRGGETGPLFREQDPTDSLLLRMLGYQETVKMPPGG